MSFGEDLKRLRELLNMNQSQFAAFVNEEQSYISNVENGMTISYKRFMKMALKAGFTAQIILTNNDQQLIINHGITTSSN